MPPSFPTRRSSDLIGARLLRQRAQRAEQLRFAGDDVVRRARLDLRDRQHRGIGDGHLARDEGLERGDDLARDGDRIDAIVRSEEHTSELQSLMRISYAVFCLKKKKNKTKIK